MFAAEKAGQWEPHKIRKKIQHNQPQGDNVQTTNEPQYEEDLLSDEGAVWPIQAGRIINWSCFLALLQYIHNTLSPTLHTPILMIAEPAWTAKDHERITQYCFESFKCPGFLLLDAAQAACYAFGLQTACVVDVGAEKANVTTIIDFLLDDSTRATSIPDCGGETLTKRLHELLEPKGFTRNMCEQLKKSPICEILLPGTPLPGQQTSQADGNKNPAAVVSTGADGPGADQRHTAGALGEAPRGPGVGTEIGGKDTLTKEEEDNEGVLDVANIVASGKMNEYLEKKEREKQEKAAAKADKKKGAEAAKHADAARSQARLKNSDKEKATFLYEDDALLEVLKGSALDSTGVAEAKAALDEGPNRKNSTNTVPAALDTSTTSTTGTIIDPNTAAISPTTKLNTSLASTTAPRREITVGTERFLSGSGPNSPLQTLSSSIHRVITSSPNPSSRSTLWNNLIIIGNGSAVRGFKEALLATLNARFLVNPQAHGVSSMFTSDLPSQFDTPNGTGANTPAPAGYGQMSQGGYMGQQQPSFNVGGANPLLVAATLNNAPDGMSAPTIHLAAQTPTSIRMAKLPEYFPEWKEVGSEEAAFLGAQVAAKMVFVVDGSVGQGRGWMSRGDYNEQGPGGVHEFSM